MPNIQVKRGARPSPRHELAAAFPHQVAPAFPSQYAVIPKQINFWHNDNHGDCVTAEEAFAKACDFPDIYITPHVVEKWANARGVYEGATLIEVLRAMQARGFHEGTNFYNDGGHQSVNWTDEPTLESAIYQGPVKLGVAGNQLQNVVTPGTNGWFATGFTEDQNLDHCVSLCGYGTIPWLAETLGVQVPGGLDLTQTGFAIFTWDSIGIIDWPSVQAITGEAWVRIPTTIMVPA